MAKVFVVTETTDYIGYGIQTSVCGVFTDKNKAEMCLNARKNNALGEFNMAMDGVYSDYITNYDDSFSIVTDDNCIFIEITEKNLD